MEGSRLAGAAVACGALRHVLACGVLVGVGLVYAWPLVRQLTTAIPGGPSDQDVATFVWNVGWVEHALTHEPGSLLRTNDVLVPFGADLRLHTYGLLEGLLAAPFVGWLGVVGAFNLVLLATLIGNGLASYALVWRESKSVPAALVAAACLLLASPVLAQMRVGRPSFAAVWLVAAALLAFGALLEQPRVWKGVALGGLLLATLVSDFQIALYAAIWLTVYAAWRLRQVGTGHVLPLGIAAIMAGLPFLVVYYPALARADAAGYPRPTLEDMLPYSFRLEDYVNPEVIPYVYGFDLLVGALLSVWLAKRSRVWLVGGMVCLVLALGPTLQPTDLPGPFAVLGLWPPLAQFRTPSRLTIPAALGLSVVLGLVLAAIFARTRRPWLSGGLAAVAVVARLAYAQVHDPLGVQTYPEYATYERIAAEPGRFTLLEVPFGVRSGLGRIGDGGEVLEYYQHVHGKPLLNGMIARLPTSVLETYAERPALLALSGQEVEETDETRRDLSAVIAWTDARYVLLHRSLLEAQEADSLERLLDTQPDLRRQSTEADLVVYAVR
jgi:hypothetical protein